MAASLDHIVAATRRRVSAAKQNADLRELEARASHADAVLLMVAALSDSELRALAQAARNLKLDVLCEVHDEAELQRALDAGCDLIGVNNRDLRTFKVDLQTALRMGPLIPS